MTSLIPLNAMVARSDRADDIVAPQFDSPFGEERYGFAVSSPDSFMNVVLSVADFPEPYPTRGDTARRASRHFKGMVERGLFESLPGQAFFLYEIATAGHRQLGIVGGVPVNAIDQGKILGHEGTFQERVDDLVRFMQEARMSSGLVTLGYPADPAHLEMMGRLASSSPLRDCTDQGGIRHRLWAVTDHSDLVDIQATFGRIRTLYIIDGHHRVAAARRLGHSPGWFLAALFPTDQLLLREYNRVINLDQLLPPEEISRMAAGDWEISEIGRAGSVEAMPNRPGEMAMLLNGVWYRLVFQGRRPNDPVDSIDVSLLHQLILGPIFGLRSYDDPSISYVPGEGSTLPFESWVDPAEAVGFALYPTSMDEVVKVAEAGREMPPKSTWFIPKPGSGLVVVRWDQSSRSD